jgi:hypothetical protein
VRFTNNVPTLGVRAICGPHVITLAWDLRDADWDAFTKDLLGFAIEKSQLKNGVVVERLFLRGLKRFEDKDKGLPAGTPVPTSEHPVQSFQWADYAVKPERKYRYRIVPAYGQPMLMELRDASATTIDVSTPDAHRGTHAVYFNRGAAASQAYAREFPDNPHPDETHPHSRQMEWLSRGLFEALVAFVDRAKGPAFALRGAFYEFHYLPVGVAFKKAIDAGADVQLFYDVANYGVPNKAMTDAAGISAVCRERRGAQSEKHNKFLVLLQNNAPVAVWTGSTNISAGGIFGHSNVGHVVFDPGVAATYLDYWNFLSADLSGPNAPIAARDKQATPTPAADPAPNSTTVMFSPRESKTLQWYADRMDGAHELVCFTVAFTVADVFTKVLKKDTDVLRYVLKDKGSKGDDEITVDKDLVLAVGAKFGKDDLANFRAEDLTGFNKNLYIHDKFMLIDPLGDDPLVVTGSANFSPTSMTSNDENMLVIRGDKDVADAYFGEFMRLFDHIYARYIITRVLPKVETLTDAEKEARRKKQFLAPDNAWVASHTFGFKQKRRHRFHGGFN